MRADRVATILRREYATRVRSVGFWLATLLTPLLVGAMVVVPSLVLVATESTHRLVVVDGSPGLGAEVAERLGGSAVAGDPAAALAESSERVAATRFDVAVVPAPADAARLRRELDRRILAGEVDAWVWIGAESVESSRVEYHAENVANFLTQERLGRVLSRVFAERRLAAAGYDAAKVVELTRAVDLETLKVTAEGTKAETGFAGLLLAYLLFFLLYTVVAVYGNAVLTGVLEEKSSRVVEVLLATTRPSELLAGKLLGIGATGLTQLGVWMVALAAITAPGVVGAMAAGHEDLVPRVSAGVALHFLAHFLLGFFLFAAMYAAIGAAANSVQDAQPFTAFVIPFLVAPALFMITVVNDPDSTLAVVLSLVPPFTPLLMLLRIVVKEPPAWQIVLGYLLTAGFVVALLAFCARIYRVGILLYGKRPTFRELGRWMLRA